jgi:putative copper resistance protein D
MSFLVDIFGYLTVVLHGLSITAEAMTVGGVAFMLFVVHPFREEMGPHAPVIAGRAWRCLAWSAAALIAIEALVAFIQVSVLSSTEDLPVAQVLGASFVTASAVKIAAALIIALLAMRRQGGMRGVLAALAVIVEAASVSASHAIAQMDQRFLLCLYEFLHRTGAAVWIGGLPYFMIALNRLDTGQAWAAVGRRYSILSVLSVSAIALAGVGMSLQYIASLPALYGTAYGVMVMTKLVLFAGLLCFGLHNYRLIERLGANPLTPILRLKRSVEVEIGVGITVFFCAASITSLPPAVDLPNDRATLHEIVERMTPEWPRLTSPQHGDLAIPALQAKLDAEAVAEKANAAAEAFVPGAGELPPRNAEDIAWSEYNHHWAGIAVLVIGLVALLERFGVKPARHWPLLFLGLAAFLLVRSDPEVWPMGSEGLLESLRDPEVVQHRLFVLVIIIFGIFEWRVRTGGLGATRAAWVFPLMTAVGAGLLLTHQHAISNFKDQLLIEYSHAPLAVFGVAAAWARWLEIRLDGTAARRAGFVWPLCFVMVGLILLDYREA